MSRRLVAPVLTSITSLFVAIALQLALPAVMLSRWGNAGYSLVITVQGFALYVSIADLGVQSFITRTLAVSVARGDLPEASAMAATAFKTLTILAVSGCVIVSATFLLLGEHMRGIVAERAGVSGGAMTLAFIVQTVASGVGVSLGGWSTGVESATGRYQRVQVMGLTRSCVNIVPLVTMAIVGASPPAALVAQAIALTTFDVMRVFFARRLLPSAHASVAAPSPLRLLSAARGSLLLAFGGATQNGLQPAITAILSANAAATAIPARTLANGARTVAIAVSNVLWVPLAAKLTRDARPADSFLMWKRASPALATLVVGGVAFLLAFGPVVAPIWLPRQSAGILSVLPLFAAEQAAFLAAFPSIMLLQALGMFGQIGAATLAAALCGSALTYVLVPHWGAWGFALAGLCATSCVYAPALVLSEYLFWRHVHVQAKGMLVERLGLSAISIALCLAHRRWPTTSAFLLLALTAACVLRWKPWQWLWPSRTSSP